MSRAAAKRGLPVMTAGVAPPADRRFRRADVRPVRRRRVGQLAWRTGRVLLPALVVLGLIGWTGRAFLGSHLFRVNHLVVNGNARLSTGEVRTLLDGLTGQNILHVDFADYRRRLMDSPWVADATMWRVLPSTVGVQITERTPMAIGRLGQQLYLVDEKGVVIDEYGPEYKDFDLPLVDGLIRQPGPASDAAVAASAALTSQFIEALRPETDLRRRVSQIDVSNSKDVVALLTDGPTLLHLGDARFVERLKMYLDLAPTLAQQFTDIDSVDLRFDGHGDAPETTSDPDQPQMIVVHAKGKIKEVVKVGK
jgi:cell division septal protein FtsQ